MHTIILINSYENKYISSNDEIFLMNSNNLPFNRLQTEKYKKKTLHKYIFIRAYRCNCPLSRFRSIRHIIHFSLPVHSRPSIARLQFTLVCSEYRQHVCKRSGYELNTAVETKQTVNIAISI